ncbi:MAG: His/Gly/Thr/Pro-type tRNA ligase C-terminal domain-containing protein, partial [Verrucomicrobiota bacterium]
LRVVQAARDLGWKTDFSLKPAKVGRQFQDAEGMGARHAIVVGAEWPVIKIKTLETRQETSIDQSALSSHLEKSDTR